MPYPWECCDCTWLDPNDKKWGECYCKKKHYYVDPGSPSCNDLNRKDSSSGCYLTTAMCNVLGFEDDCAILNNLRDFRDFYMKNKEEYLPLLEDYDTVGPIIAENLVKDKNKVFNAKLMLYFYISPAIAKIKKEKYDEAIELYKDMTINLMHTYNIDRNLLASEKTITRKREFNA